MPLENVLAAAGSGALVILGLWALALVLGRRRRRPTCLVRRLKGGAQ